MGIMAMMGRNAAVAEAGRRHHELEGVIAFAAWLGVHAALLSTSRAKIAAFMEWAWDYFGNVRGVQPKPQRRGSCRLERQPKSSNAEFGGIDADFGKVSNARRNQYPFTITAVTACERGPHDAPEKRCNRYRGNSGVGHAIVLELAKAKRQCRD
jgi:hypothetical protein